MLCGAVAEVSLDARKLIVVVLMQVAINVDARTILVAEREVQEFSIHVKGLDRAEVSRVKSRKELVLESIGLEATG